MSYRIEPRKVAGVVAECNNTIIKLQANHGEVLLGLSELLGRIIVDVSNSPIQYDEVWKIVEARLMDTVTIGAAAKGVKVIVRE